jgi:myo-inositol-1(or 4)-monophosphatase
MNPFVREQLIQAGRKLKGAFGGNMVSVEKARFDLVTEMDVQIERMLIADLRAHYPRDSFVGEETGQTPGSSDARWLIDPIDGTTNFVMGEPYFAISLARIYGEEVVEAYVYNPISEELYWSTAEGGVSYLNAECIRVSATEHLRDALIAFGFSARIEAIQRYYEEWTTIWQGCRKGVGWVVPSLSLCNVARGRIDAFIDFGASPVGKAAGALILANAGGTVSSYDLTTHDMESCGVVGCTPCLFAVLKESRRA